MSRVKAMLDVYSGVTKKKDEDTGKAHSKLQENGILTSSHRFRVNTSILVRPYGYGSETTRDPRRCSAPRMRTTSEHQLCPDEERIDAQRFRININSDATI